MGGTVAAAGQWTSRWVLDRRMNGRSVWSEVDLAKIRVYYCTVSDYRIIGSHGRKASKGKGTATATATGSVFSVLETEGTAFGLVSCFATFDIGRFIRGLVVTSSSGVGGAIGLASILATFARRSSIGVRIPRRGSVVVISGASARLAICGHCGLKNFKNKRGCDNLAKKKKELRLLLEVDFRVPARESDLRRLHLPQCHAARWQRARARDSLRSRWSRACTRPVEDRQLR